MSARTLRESALVVDSYARNEWGWKPTYDVAAMIDDFLTELGRS